MFLDEQRVSGIGRRDGGRAMMVFIGGDDDGIHFGARDQFLEISGFEIRIDIVCQTVQQVFLHVAQADPADSGIVPCKLCPDTSYGAAADHRKSEGFSVFSHGPFVP